MTVRPGRLILWSVGALVVAAIAWSFRPQPVPVDMAVVARGSLRVTIDEEGMTRVRERYVVSAPVAGRMQRLDLEPGQPVEARRTVIATFLPAAPPLLDARTWAETEARMKAAKATRDEARVALQRARDDAAFGRSELARQRQIAKFGGVTDERLAAVALDARTKEGLVSSAELALQRAEHEFEAARAALQAVSSTGSGAGGGIALRSPVDGVVLRLLQESEAPVAAGTPLVEIGNPDELEIVSDLLSTDAVKVQPGHPAIIDGWGGGVPLTGRVRLVEPAAFTKISALGVEEQRVNVLIDFDDARGEGARQLGDGYRVEVSIVIWERKDVLKISTSALFRIGESWSVFAARDGTAVRTDVQIGQRNALEAEVLSGLSEGDRVIVHPGDATSDGVAITAQ